MRALLQRLFPARPKPPAPPREQGAPQSPEEAVPSLLWPVADQPLSGTRPSTGEQYALTVVRGRVRAAACPAGLIGRAPVVIPRLMAMLRQDNGSTTQMAEQVMQDPILAAAVLRLSQSPLYRIRRDVNDMETALAVIGVQGLRAAIANVILKPIFQERPWGLVGEASGRMWVHGELQATLAGAKAVTLGADRLDGYLAGLLHNLGWTAVLRSLDLARVPLNPPFSEGFAHAMLRARARMFGRLMTAWDVTPGLTRLGRELMTPAPDAVQGPLIDALRDADVAATRTLFPIAEATSVEANLV
ncbi:MAG: HDOD domain-containing protein [Gammaproteobacteria bacterium]|nr:MAG: HDOD domain-containing protein [Gammaproteobacteria bacterium]